MAILKKISSSVRLTYTLGWGFFTLYRIGSFSEPKREVLSPHINKFFIKMVNSLGIQVEVVGDIPKKNALWVGNHISWLDIAIVGSTCPVFFLSKIEVKSWPLFGKLATSAGTMYINRGSGDSGSVMNQITGFLKEGISVIFFPEATTTDGRAVKKLHGKLLQSSLDSGVPVQPVMMCYINEHGQLDMNMPYIDDMTFGESMNNIMNSKKTTAYIMALDAIDPAGHDRDSLTELLQVRMQEGLEKLHEKAVTQK